MGSFNTVILRCPGCGDNVRFQSKAGSCAMKTRGLFSSEPADLVAAAATEHVCESCGDRFGVSVVVNAREFPLPNDAEEQD